MPAFVSIRNGPFRDISRALVRRWAERMLASLDLSSAELSVAITDDSEIRELNKVFRHRDKATDVLAFAMREGQPVGATSPPSERRTKKRERELLGDVVVSVETARRQAKEHRRRLDAEIRMLLAHGLLHLVGYDHQTDRQEAAMNAATEKLCKAAAKTRTRAPLLVRSRGSKSGTSRRAASRKATQ
jgi:probable rRNA maturation factor